MKWSTGSLLVSPVGSTQLFTVKSKLYDSVYHIQSCAIAELFNRKPLFSDGWTLWLISTRRIQNTLTFVTLRGGFSAARPKRFPTLHLLFKISLIMLTFLGQRLTERAFPWLTGGRQPALHHGLPEGELAEARPLGSKPGEPAPRVPPLRCWAGPRERRRRNGGQDVIQAPGLPGTLTQYGQSERHQLETPV